MKKLLIALFVLGISLPASAQSFIGPEVKHVGSETSLLFNGLYTKSRPVGDSGQTVGYFVYGLIDESSWGQLYGGLVYNPRGWISFSAGAGTEKAHDPWRVGGSIWAGGHGNSALFVVEDGGSGFWYRAQYTRRLNSKLNVGVFSRRYSPSGPILEVNLSKRFMLWTAIGPNLESGDMTSVTSLIIALP